MDVRNVRLLCFIAIFIIGIAIGWVGEKPTLRIFKLEAIEQGHAIYSPDKGEFMWLRSHSDE